MKPPFVPQTSSAPPTSSITSRLSNATVTLRPLEWRYTDSNIHHHNGNINIRGENVETFRDQENGRKTQEKFYKDLHERHRVLSREILYQGYAQQSAKGNGYNHESSKRLRRLTSLQVKQPSLLSSTSVPGNNCPLRRSQPALGHHHQAVGLGRLRPLALERVPSSIEEIDVDVDDQSDGKALKDSIGAKKEKKRVRYLRDTDRYNIIQRIENGEKQAAIAREFGVTRAAICHIKKNRLEIMSRYNMLMKSAKEMNGDHTVNLIGSPPTKPTVHERHANSVLLLMTILRDHRSSNTTFRRVADRLIMILLEEAFACMSTQKVQVITNTGHVYSGIEICDQVCGVALGAESLPLLVLFHQMEPEAPQGSIHVAKESEMKFFRACWRLEHISLPANVDQHKILLLSSTCSTGEAECKAIEALCSIGCDEHNIFLVVLLIASDGLSTVSSRFPQVKVISGGIDAKVDPRTGRITPGFGDFVSRYSGR